MLKKSGLSFSISDIVSSVKNSHITEENLYKKLCSNSFVEIDTEMGIIKYNEKNIIHYAHINDIKAALMNSSDKCLEFSKYAFSEDQKNEFEFLVQDGAVFKLPSRDTNCFSYFWNTRKNIHSVSTEIQKLWNETNIPTSNLEINNRLKSKKHPICSYKNSFIQMNDRSIQLENERTKKSRLSKNNITNIHLQHLLDKKPI